MRFCIENNRFGISRRARVMRDTLIFITWLNVISRPMIFELTLYGPTRLNPARYEM